MTVSSRGNPGRRIDSWKEIASYLARDERTVRRWEKDHSLPVHRIPSGSKGRVYAYESELCQWLSASRDLEPEIRIKEAPPAEPIDPPEIAEERRTPSSVAKWVAVLALCLATAAAILFYRGTPRSAVQASSAPGTATEDVPTTSPSNPEVEELYLQGRYYWNKRTPEDLNRAVDYFTQAVDRDPHYAKAYVGLADSYNLLREFSAMPAGQAYPLALAAATKAVELDDNSADARTSLAFVTFFWSWDAVGAEREFKHALVLDPKDSRAHHWYASFLLTCRRYPESLAEIEIARRLDPSSVSILADKAQILQVSRHTDAAIALLKQIETTDPSFASAHRYLSEIYFTRKNYPGYLSELKQTAVLLHDQNDLEVARAAEHGFQKGGKRGMLQGMLDIQKRLHSEQALSGFWVAVTYARLGDTKDALQYLTEAYQKHDSLVLYLGTEPSFDVLHDEPEYRSLVARVIPTVRFPAPAANLITKNF